MTRKSKTFTSLFLLGTFMPATGLSISAQKRQPAPDRQMIERVRIPGPDGPQTPPPDDNFIFVASEMNADGKLVKGAPYSAQAVTETKQTLSDGNRIINKSTATVYRDSDGRTRREQTLKVIGPFAYTGEPPQTIFINDPVAGVNYALDSHFKVAHKMPPMRFEFKMAFPGDGPGAPMNTPPPALPSEGSGPVFERMAPAPDGPGMQANGPAPVPHPDMPATAFERAVPVPPGPEGGFGMVFQWQGGRDDNAKTESLGKQIIEGVEAEGTRNTVEIPAGEIGNERPIEIVFERWYSLQLQVVVMTRHSDPRFGETTYRLTNINRSEPAHSLFEVPSDYKVREDWAPEPMRMKRQRDPE
jgi:hypothetical protein